MPFQIKDFNSIALSEINHARSVTDKITDFQPGSVARTLLEAPAAEIEELYIQMFLGLRDAIPVATFKSFGFPKLPGAIAAGYVNVESLGPRLEPISVPAGTEFVTDDARTYTSVSDLTWGTSDGPLQVLVRYSAVGTEGNAVAGAISGSPLFSTDAFTIGNEAITNGLDEESDTDREARFADYIRSISSGTTVACLYAAKSAVVLNGGGEIQEYVTRSGLTEVPGIVTIYIYSNIGSPSDEMLAAAQYLIDGDEQAGVAGARAGGVRVDVVAMAERAITMTATVGMMAGYTLDSAKVQELRSIYGTAIRAVKPGETLQLATLREELLTAANVLSVSLSATANIVCGQGEALVPGTLSVVAAP